MATLGDIALVGYSADGTKSFSFVILADLSGQTINFTDNGWVASTSSFRTTEGHQSYTVPLNTPIGTVVTLPGVAGNFNLSATGDSIIAYTGTATSPTMLFALDVADGNATYAADATNSNTSAVPPGLTFGETALAFTLDNGAYAGPLTGTKAEILANIADETKWTLDDAAAVAYPASFSVGTAGSAQISISDVSIAEGDAGTQIATFTVSRTSTDGAFSIDFATSNGSATAGSDYEANSGTLSFAAGGGASQTISVTINGDTDIEPTESFSVNLTNLVITSGAASIADGAATGTITNDDIVVTYIHDIQGGAFFSPILAAEGISSFNVASASQVTVNAVVTAIDTFGSTQGFYISEQLTDWDASGLTSEGIFVRTSGSTAGLTVGETVTVTANVMEFQDFTNLNRTYLVNASSIVQANDLVDLPTFIINGTPGHSIPTQIISDDNPVFTDATGASGTFDPQNDALDFYETVEGMRVTMTNMIVGDGFVGGSNDNFVYFNAYSADNADPALINVRGGYTTTGDPQLYPIDTVGTGDDVKFGGATVADGATHGDIIELDFGNVGRGGAAGFDQLLTMGDELGDVTGIIDFDFGVAKLFVTDALDATKVANLGGSPEQEVTALTGDDRALRVATFNVENLSPVGTTFSTNNGVEITTADKYTKLAAHIATNLQAPDILIIEEVQDNNGVTADGVTDASTTWGELVDAVNAATGKHYQWVDEAPAISGNVGGAPGGNIRVGFLYDTDRVQLGNLAADATLAERRAYTDLIGDGVRTAGDLIAIDDSQVAGINAADWSGTRRSIVGEFEFNGQTVYAFGSHLPSKGGSGEPYQLNQNNSGGQPANGDWALRNTLAQDVWSVQDLASSVADAKVVSGGDFNEFWYNRPLEVLTGHANPDGSANTTGTDYVNLMVDKLAAVDRFSYDFDGRSQALDTIIADQTLASVASYDVVHINTGYNDRAGAVNPASSDHDPSLASFDFRSFDETLSGTAGTDILQGFGGDDTLSGGAGNDTAVFSGNRAGYSVTANGTVVTDTNLADGDDGIDTLSEFEFLQFADQTLSTASFMAYTLQLLHFSDAEAGQLAPQTAPYLAALVDAFEDSYANSITVASGDLFLPGPFLAAGTDASLASLVPGNSNPARVDISIMNAIGIELSALGNHEFDLGSNVLSAAITPGSGYAGALFPYLSANLDFAPAGFAADPLNGRFTQTVGVGGLEEASSLKGRVAPSAVITEGGEKIGFVGATTQVLESISSPSGAEVKGFAFGLGPNGETNDIDLLAAQLQIAINDLTSQGVNKIVIVSHLQQIAFEQLLATKLTGVDVIISGGSNTRLGDADDVAVAFPAHEAAFDGTYPIITAGLDGKTTVIVNTDGEYTYLGRLVVQFDSNGDIITQSLTDNVPINGAYASTAENVAEAWGVAEADLDTTAFAAGTRGDRVETLTDAIANVIELKDGNIYGYSDVYLEGERVFVRTQETNLGNVSADANADVARDALGLSSDHAIVSIKNGGGIRAQIGTIDDDGNGGVIKIPPTVDGEVSQLDVENALRFDNKLMVFDTTAQGLLNILNSPNALAPNNGGFVQIGGVRFSYDPTKTAGSRVQDIVLINEHDQITAVIADNGVVNPNAPSVITAVALNFTANGGDGYLVKANAENFRYLLNDGTTSAPVSEALDFTAAANVPANAIGEQQAFAQYFQERYATPETAYAVADTSQLLDTRIQNQAVRTDTVLQGDYLTLGTNAGETLNGTDGVETLKGLAGNDKINGLAGDDLLNGGKGADVLNGGDGSDTATYVDAITGVSASLLAGRGSYGEANGDRLINLENLTGSSHDDVLTGNRGANVIHGGAGDDIIDGAGGADLLFGDDGDDAFEFDGNAKPVSIDGGAGHDTIRANEDGATLNWASYTSVEVISADGYTDVRIAGSQTMADLIDLSSFALEGIAAIQGRGGADTIIGSAGNDVISGGTGIDSLSGGLGADNFLFARGETGKTIANGDSILDFSSIEGDRIDLSAIDANSANGTGDDAFTFIGTDAFTNVAGQLRYAISGGETLLTGDFNGDGKADLLIHLSNAPALVAADFVL